MFEKELFLHQREFFPTGEKNPETKVDIFEKRDVDIDDFPGAVNLDVIQSAETAPSNIQELPDRYTDFEKTLWSRRYNGEKNKTEDLLSFYESFIVAQQESKRHVLYVPEGTNLSVQSRKIRHGKHTTYTAKTEGMFFLRSVGKSGYETISGTNDKVSFDKYDTNKGIWKKILVTITGGRKLYLQNGYKEGIDYFNVTRAKINSFEEFAEFIDISDEIKRLK